MISSPTWHRFRRWRAADGYASCEEYAPGMKPRAGLSPSRLAAAGLRSASMWRTRKSRSRTAWGGGKVSARSRSRAARGDFFGATRKRFERVRREEYTFVESALNLERSPRVSWRTLRRHGDGSRGRDVEFDAEALRLSRSSRDVQQDVRWQSHGLHRDGIVRDGKVGCRDRRNGGGRK